MDVPAIIKGALEQGINHFSNESVTEKNDNDLSTSVFAEIKSRSLEQKDGSVDVADLIEKFADDEDAAEILNMLSGVDGNEEGIGGADLGIYGAAVGILGEDNPNLNMENIQQIASTIVENLASGNNDIENIAEQLTGIENLDVDSNKAIEILTQIQNMNATDATDGKATLSMSDFKAAGEGVKIISDDNGVITRQYLNTPDGVTVYEHGHYGEDGSWINEIQSVTEKDGSITREYFSGNSEGVDVADGTRVFERGHFDENGEWKADIHTEIKDGVLTREYFGKDRSGNEIPEGTKVFETGHFKEQG
ncbi:hypothetical protein IJ670_01945 [bacterium]|nr:hypothetical protein [bacterium]